VNNIAYIHGSIGRQMRAIPLGLAAVLALVSFHLVDAKLNGGHVQWAASDTQQEELPEVRTSHHPRFAVKRC
jgi:hypothetical protein